MDDIAIAKEAALIGGQTAVQYRHRGELAVYGKGGVDYSTPADVAVERAMREHLRGHSSYPIFGEEEGGDMNARVLWVVDPIDGTGNYLRGWPEWSSWVALLDGDTARVAAASRPDHGNVLYTAERGMGFFIHRGNESRRCSLPPAKKEPKDLMVAADLMYSGRQWKLGKLGTFADKVRGLLITGSASVCSTAIASGSLDAYIIWEAPINDTIAGALMVEEAGGYAVNERGERFTRRDTNLILARSEAIKDFLLEHIGE